MFELSATLGPVSGHCSYSGVSAGGGAGQGRSRLHSRVCVCVKTCVILCPDTDFRVRPRGPSVWGDQRLLICSWSCGHSGGHVHCVLDVNVNTVDTCPSDGGSRRVWGASVCLRSSIQVHVTRALSAVLITGQISWRVTGSVNKRSEVFHWRPVDSSSLRGNCIRAVTDTSLNC